MALTGTRQGTTEVGFQICPHTCGCLISDGAANKSHKRPKWLRRTPVSLKAGNQIISHIRNHEVHPNCGNSCKGLNKQGRSLTDEEYQAWVPHLGNWTQLHIHIPHNFHALIPANPLEDEYQGIPPLHPLPLPPASTSSHLQATGSGLGTCSCSMRPPSIEAVSGSGSGTASGATAPTGDRELFTGTPSSCVKNVTSAPAYHDPRSQHIKAALQTAPEEVRLKLADTYIVLGDESLELGLCVSHFLQVS
jgi:hypothetical protein